MSLLNFHHPSPRYFYDPRRHMQKKIFEECSSGLAIPERPIFQGRVVCLSAGLCAWEQKTLGLEHRSRNHAQSAEIFPSWKLQILCLTFLNVKIQPLSRVRPPFWGSERSSGLSFLVETQIIVPFVVLDNVPSLPFSGLFLFKDTLLFPLLHRDC